MSVPVDICTLDNTLWWIKTCWCTSRTGTAMAQPVDYEWFDNRLDKQTTQHRTNEFLTLCITSL